VNTGLLLEDRGHILTFNLPAGDGENKISFGKISVPSK